MPTISPAGRPAKGQNSRPRPGCRRWPARRPPAAPGGARAKCVRVHLDRRLAVLQLVRGGKMVDQGSLPALRTGTTPGAADGSPPPRRAGSRGPRCRPPASEPGGGPGGWVGDRPGAASASKDGTVGEQRGQVLEQDARLREVGDVDRGLRDALVERLFGGAVAGDAFQGPAGPGRCGRAPGRGVVVRRSRPRRTDAATDDDAAGTWPAARARRRRPRRGPAARRHWPPARPDRRPRPARASAARRASTRRRSAIFSGSRSLRSATIGVARKIDE